VAVLCASWDRAEAGPAAGADDDDPSAFPHADELFLQSDDVHVVASALKKWLRSQAEPLITADVYEEAVDAGKLESCDSATVSCVLAMLPQANRDLATQLFAFLAQIDPAATKMTPANLGICIAPCVFRHPDPATAMANNSWETRFVSWAVSEWDRSLVVDDYKQALRKWLVRQGYGGASGGVLAAFGRRDGPPSGWMAGLRAMSTRELKEMAADVGKAEADKASAVTRTLSGAPPSRSRIMRRLSSIVEGSPRNEIRGCGHQLFEVKQRHLSKRVAKSNVLLGVGGMGLTLFSGRDEPVSSHMYRHIVGVSMSDSTVYCVCSNLPEPISFVAASASVASQIHSAICAHKAVLDDDSDV
jgi:hypothetical protein